MKHKLQEGVIYDDVDKRNGFKIGSKGRRKRKRQDCAVITLHNLGFDNKKIRMEVMNQYQISKEEVNRIILDNIH